MVLPVQKNEVPKLGLGFAKQGLPQCGNLNAIASGIAVYFFNDHDCVRM